MKLSAILITKNEAFHLRACLESVAFADQIVVVDSGSTDDTVEIARAAGAKVIQTGDWPGFGPQKNRALAAADGEWVLSIDADERVGIAHFLKEFLRIARLVLVGEARQPHARPHELGALHQFDQQWMLVPARRAP